METLKQLIDKLEQEQTLSSEEADPITPGI